MAAHLYFIRHGQTDWNINTRLQGQTDIPLNALGEKQATQSGGVLKALVARESRSLDKLHFVSSPLGRTRRTMELLRGELGLPGDGYAIDDRLREIAFGTWEGFTYPELRVRDPENFKVRERNRWEFAAPGGESYAQVSRRMQEWFESLPGDTVAVAHGGTCRALMVILGHLQQNVAVEHYIEQGVVYSFGLDGLTRHK